MGSLLARGADMTIGMFNRTLAAKGEIKQARKKAEDQLAELKRQQKRMTEITSTKKGDAVRRYEKELGTMRAASAEAAASGGSFTRLAAEIGGNEGRTLGIIQSEFEDQWGQAQQERINITKEYNDASSALADSINNANWMALVGFAGFQLKGDPVAAQQRLTQGYATNVNKVSASDIYAGVQSTISKGGGRATPSGGGVSYERTSRPGGIGGL